MNSLNGSLAEWHYLKGLILERYNPVDSFAIAYQSFKKAIACNPGFTKAFRETGWLFLKNNKKDSAAVYLKKYLSDTPDASDMVVLQFYLRNIP